jgi:hypothetical protein
MSDDRRALRAARIAKCRETLSGPLLADDRASLREKLDRLIRLQACDAPLSQEEIDYAAVVSGEAMLVGRAAERSGSKRGEAVARPAPAPGLTKRLD